MNAELKYVIYLRKSTDNEDKQIQSIEDQLREVNKEVERKGIKIVRIFEESKSAKKPGREQFMEMMTMIKRGEANGIVCWKLNRLARNPVDGGEIQWLLQQGIIQSIVTAGREYLPSDNVLMMAVELGMANQFVIDLSKDVKRGLDTKNEKGWKPGIAPLGYKNDKYGDKGNKQVFIDEDTFPIVRKLWELLLSESYSVEQIARIATEEYGLKGRKKGLDIHGSTLYGVFTNTFYYGEYTFSGETFQGKHQTMITVEEFDRAQQILGTRGKPRPINKRLPYNGIVTCGECGGMITTDDKYKKIKATGESRRYIYHRCTKRRSNIKCFQKPITHISLNNQISEYLEQMTIPPQFLQWATQQLKKENEIQDVERNAILRSQRQAYDTCLARLSNLTNLYINPDNADRSLLDEDEFKRQKDDLRKEKLRLEQEIRKIETGADEWFTLAEKTFDFATYASYNFEKGNFETKTSILRSIGTSFTLKDGKLDVKFQDAFLSIKEGFEKEPLKIYRLEPEEIRSIETKNDHLKAALELVSCHPGSNWRPHPYHGCALPTEL
jgi:site-specific DNA recombinase